MKNDSDFMVGGISTSTVCTGGSDALQNIVVSIDL